MRDPLVKDERHVAYIMQLVPVLSLLLKRDANRTHLRKSDPRVHANSETRAFGASRFIGSIDHTLRVRVFVVRIVDWVHLIGCTASALGRTHIPIKAGFIPATSPRANINRSPSAATLLLAF